MPTALTTDLSRELARLLLLRSGRVVLPTDFGSSAASPEARERTREGLRALETDLLALGYGLSGQLYVSLSQLDDDSLAELGSQLLEDLTAAKGAHVHHVPQFRNFPDSTPRDTEDLFWNRLYVFFFQRPEAPCVMCENLRPRAGSEDSAEGAQPSRIHALDPCGHLVCDGCFDGADYSGCPICHRRISSDNPFLQDMPSGKPRLPAPLVEGQPLTLLRPAAAPLEEATALLHTLLGRTSPLNPTDLETVRLLLSYAIERHNQDFSALLPPEIPVKETLATVLAELVQRYPQQAEQILARAQTVTDVLRTTLVLQGGEPSLLAAPPSGRVKPEPRSPWSRAPLAAAPPQPHQRNLSRGLRRAILARLEQMPAAAIFEEFERQAQLWKIAARGLHPFESAHVRRYPHVALGFALLRGESVDTGRLAGAWAAVGERCGAERDAAGKLRYRSWASRLEEALAAQDVDAATKLLAARPGELMRRIDHVLRLIDSAQGLPRQLTGAFDAATAQAASPMLITLAAHLRGRALPLPRRVFMPKGEAAMAQGVDEKRQPLAAELIAPLIARIESELLARCGAGGYLDGVVVDEETTQIPLPMGERSATAALTEIPRGTLLDLPQGDRPMRLFVHWMEGGSEAGQNAYDSNQDYNYYDYGRVDLDLSVVFYDENGKSLGECAYTNLRFGDDAAVHSGDLTSAPPPLGASEFVDLDLPKLRQMGVRRLVMTIFSFNSVPFERIGTAFAGWMPLAPGEQLGAGAQVDYDDYDYSSRRNRQRRQREAFHPGAVEQRFDLYGDSKLAVPLAVDLDKHQARWIDLRGASRGMVHATWNHGKTLGMLAADLDYAFAYRPTLADVGLLLGAARAQRLLVRDRSGRMRMLERNQYASAEALLAAARSGQGEWLEEAQREQVMREGQWLAVMGSDDATALPVGSSLYALRAHNLLPEVEYLRASDLVTLLGSA